MLLIAGLVAIETGYVGACVLAVVVLTDDPRRLDAMALPTATRGLDLGGGGSVEVGAGAKRVDSEGAPDEDKGAEGGDEGDSVH
jgi:hypothetical protein